MDIGSKKLIVKRTNLLNYGTTYLKKLHTEETGQELDQRVIAVWKYVRTGINKYLKNQVKNDSKMNNSLK